MPELPDVAVYIESLEARIVGRRLERILLKNPFLLRTAEPPPQSCEGHSVTQLRPARQTHRYRFRQRCVAGDSSDDRGPAALV